MDRVCTGCGIAKPRGAFSRFRTAAGTEGLRYKCKECYRDKRKPVARGSKSRDDEKRIKRCSACGDWKPFAEYSPRSGERSTQLRSRCRECERIDGLENLAKNRESINARRREKGTSPEHSRRWAINKWAKRLGMSAEELRAIVDHPNLVCEICGRVDGDCGGRSGRLHIDHDHATGKFRGLLCPDCNLTLGKMKDDPELLRRAADYLERDNEARASMSRDTLARLCEDRRGASNRV